MHYIVNKVQLNVLELGNGPLTLVFLHYFGGSALEWQPVMSQLAGQYHCLAIDLRGHGDSAAPSTDYSVNTMADDVLAVIRQLHGQRFVLVGHSMGGKVALTLASRQPTGLQSVILVSPSPPSPEPITEADRKDLLETHGQRSAAEKTFTNITAKRLSMMIRAQIIADNLRTSELAWRAWLMSGSKEDLSGLMSTIDVPVAILAGVNDKAIPPHVQSVMTLPYLETATPDIADRAGHLLPLESPDELAAFIRQKLTHSGINKR